MLKLRARAQMTLPPTPPTLLNMYGAPYKMYDGYLVHEYTCGGTFSSLFLLFSFFAFFSVSAFQHHLYSIEDE